MKHGQSLELDRCPHCNVAKPNLNGLSGVETQNDRNQNPRTWRTYSCRTCGGVVLAVAPSPRGESPKEITQIWPAPQQVNDAVPARARAFLEQAIASVHAPAGAVMLTASAVDAMLKEKGLKEGTLYKRIDAASAQSLITAEMAAWAHEVRLEANDQRHADEEAVLPDEADANKAIEFAIALAQFLFVLPARVARGRGKE
jgi:hypothetical protein